MTADCHTNACGAKPAAGTSTRSFQYGHQINPPAPRPGAGRKNSRVHTVQLYSYRTSFRIRNFSCLLEEFARGDFTPSWPWAKWSIWGDMIWRWFPQFHSQNPYDGIPSREARGNNWDEKERWSMQYSRSIPTNKSAFVRLQIKASLSITWQGA